MILTSIYEPVNQFQNFFEDNRYNYVGDLFRK